MLNNIQINGEKSTARRNFICGAKKETLHKNVNVATCNRRIHWCIYLPCVPIYNIYTP